MRRGGFASQHFDACNGSEDFCFRVNGDLGQRWITVILYLNEDFYGGETFFPKINKLVKPEIGKAVFFLNIRPDSSVIEESYHEGLKVTEGDKWIATKWIRIGKPHASVSYSPFSKPEAFYVKFGLTVLRIQIHVMLYVFLLRVICDKLSVKVINTDTHPHSVTNTTTPKMI